MNREKELTRINESIILTKIGFENLEEEDLTKADLAFKEALEIRMQLSERYRSIYLPYIADSLNNMGLLHCHKREFESAAELYQRALEIRREVVQNNVEGLPDLADSLNRFGGFEKARKNNLQAEESYNEALNIYKYLATDQPEYSIFVATTLEFLAELNHVEESLEALKRAEQYYLEAISIEKKQSRSTAQITSIANLMSRLGDVYFNLTDFEHAEKSYRIALANYKELPASERHLHFDATKKNCLKLANIYKHAQDYPKAEKSYLAALAAYKSHKDKSQTHRFDTAVLEITISLFYQDQKPHKKNSIKFLDDAIVNLGAIERTKHVDKYLRLAVIILEDWEIDGESYLKKKLDFD